MTAFVNMMDLVYPIGSIYQSMSPTNPGAIFLGQWTQITNKFLYASNNSNVTGGNASHSHAVAMLFPEYYGWGNITANKTYGMWPAAGIMDYDKNHANKMTDWGTGENYVSGIMKDNSGYIVTTDVKKQTGATGATSILPPYTTCYTWYRTS